MTSLWLDIGLTVLFYSITHSFAFVLGSCWHHAYRGEENRK
jgi:hypothetical protein